MLRKKLLLLIVICTGIVLFADAVTGKKSNINDKRCFIGSVSIFDDMRNIVGNVIVSGRNNLPVECYFEKDLSILQDFIDLNTSLQGKNPLNIGIQEWKNRWTRNLHIF